MSCYSLPSGDLDDLDSLDDQGQLCRDSWSAKTGREGLLDAGPDGEALVGVPQYTEGSRRTLHALATGP